MKGKLIVIEGGDGSGKATQAKLLFEKMKKNKMKVEMLSFPRYENSLSGKLIGELLAGKHGDFMSMSPYVSSLPYVLDRVSVASEMREKLKKGIHLICDRFTPSNLAHQMAKLPETEQDEFADFLERLEHEELQIPRPDLVLYLSVPADISYALVLQKAKRGYLDEGKARDVAERNHEHQQKTRKIYEKLSSVRDSWRMLDCAPAGMLKSREDIHKDVWDIVSKFL